MGTYRIIIHFDFDAFFCAVEEHDQPSLRGIPFAVGGHLDGRGVVISCSYAARRFGVQSDMPITTAMRLCPPLVVIPPRHRAYEKVSQEAMDYLSCLTETLQQISIDEAFLDITNLQKTSHQVATLIQENILRDLGLPCSLGISTNRFVAKIANSVGKSAFQGNGPPNAITVVPPGSESAFLSPLPISRLWGVGPKTTIKMNSLGIHTIGNLANFPIKKLSLTFGNQAWKLVEKANGRDGIPITANRTSKTISKETTFTKNISKKNYLHAILLYLSEEVGRELRRGGLSCHTIRLKSRTSNFVTSTKQIALPISTNMDKVIYNQAKNLVHQAWEPQQPLRLLGISASNLGSSYQLSLWQKKDFQIQKTIDHLRNHYGNKVIHWAKEKHREVI